MTEKKLSLKTLAEEIRDLRSMLSSACSTTREDAIPYRQRIEGLEDRMRELERFTESGRNESVGIQDRLARCEDRLAKLIEAARKKLGLRVETRTEPVHSRAPGPGKL